MLGGGVAAGTLNELMACGGGIGSASESHDHPDLAKGAFDDNFTGTASSTGCLHGGEAYSI